MLYLSNKTPIFHILELLRKSISFVNYELIGANSASRQKTIGGKTLSNYLKYVRNETNNINRLITGKKFGVGHCGEFADRLKITLIAALPLGSKVCKIVYQHPQENDNHAFIVVQIPGITTLQVDAWDKRIELINSGENYEYQYMKKVGAVLNITPAIKEQALAVHQAICKTECVAMVSYRTASYRQKYFPPHSYKEPDKCSIYLGKGIVSSNARCIKIHQFDRNHSYEHRSSKNMM